MSDDLINRLTNDLKPARQGMVTRRLGVALAVGAGIAFVGVLRFLGMRPDMPGALGTTMFWMKLAYTAAFGAIAVLAVERLSRPSASLGARLVWLAAPVLVIVVAAAARLMTSPPGSALGLVMGHSWRVCPWCIALTATPVFAALIWALRGLAPTQLRLTGALAGLASGGLGAAVYSLHCPEAAAPFVAVWYSLGMLIPTAVGALLGPRLLRW